MARTRYANLTGLLLFLSILLNLAFAFYVGRRVLVKSVSASTYSAPPKLWSYMNRHELFETLPADTGAVVFLGNSLTQYYELAEFFPDVRVKNRGIHGDMMEKVLQRLSSVTVLKPRKIFIELGVNDVEQLVPTAKFLSLYAQMLDTLKAACPRTKIYMQSLFPVADTSLYMPVSYCSPVMNKKVVAMNEELRKLAVTKACTFIDLHDRFAEKGQISPAYTVDGVHLSGAGYRLWTNILRPYVEK